MESLCRTTELSSCRWRISGRSPSSFLPRAMMENDLRLPMASTSDSPSLGGTSLATSLTVWPSAIS